jgi:hypothetical protein
MIDRPARDQAAAALKSFMNEEITAFQLNDRLFAGANPVRDETLQSLSWAVWSHYDDIQDHKIVATKEEWDFLNRVRLLLESVAEIKTSETRRTWHLRQAVAAVSLALFCLVAGRTGIGNHLLIYAMPFGLVSMGLAWWKRRDEAKASLAQAAITPFPSVSNLLTLRRSISGFQKLRYRAATGQRRIRGRLVESAYWLQWGVFWLMFAPVALLFQTLPGKESDLTIVTSHPAAGGERIGTWNHVLLSPRQVYIGPHDVVCHHDPRAAGLAGRGAAWAGAAQ